MARTELTCDRLQVRRARGRSGRSFHASLLFFFLLLCLCRLGPLGILVKELTGDMQLTKKELAETQLIVTTPEKWDVVTRKNHDGGSGGTGLMSLVKLLIIDECHLLNEDRGPVLEILVARTLRLVESSQQMCRIVGLSATLPNYNDVAVFLRANPSSSSSSPPGLFHFDASYRPVPLSQTFIGVTEPNQMKRLQSMNEITYKKCLERVKQGHQVMIFVHSRRDTVKTAKFLRDAAQTDQNLAFFDMTKDPQYSAFERKVQRSVNVVGVTNARSYLSLCPFSYHVCLCVSIVAGRYSVLATATCRSCSSTASRCTTRAWCGRTARSSSRHSLRASSKCSCARPRSRGVSIYPHRLVSQSSGTFGPAPDRQSRPASAHCSLSLCVCFSSCTLSAVIIKGTQIYNAEVSNE